MHNATPRLILTARTGAWGPRVTLPAGATRRQRIEAQVAVAVAAARGPLHAALEELAAVAESLTAGGAR